ncbi:hypothetical protein NHQ30_009515 [Ciborinia camelliae]|nr:hypothetical protein NHQ30_009515 [Ciborinia camelliae]
MSFNTENTTSSPDASNLAIPSQQTIDFLEAFKPKNLETLYENTSRLCAAREDVESIRKWLSEKKSFAIYHYTAPDSRRTYVCDATRCILAGCLKSKDTNPEPEYPVVCCLFDHDFPHKTTSATAYTIRSLIAQLYDIHVKSGAPQYKTNEFSELETIGGTKESGMRFIRELSESQTRGFIVVIDDSTRLDIAYIKECRVDITAWMIELLQALNPGEDSETAVKVFVRNSNIVCNFFDDELGRDCMAQGSTKVNFEEHLKREFSKLRSNSSGSN